MVQCDRVPEVSQIPVAGDTRRVDYESAGVLLVVHGVTEHSGRYDKLLAHFVPEGFAVGGFDHIGQGWSEGRGRMLRGLRIILEPYGPISGWCGGWGPPFIIRYVAILAMRFGSLFWPST